ncbi:MAG: zinc-binding alcohol dehydrogenase [Planctomycetota bacterium]|jgi:L-iditol 2-dehydrogenase|nr:zinc-binding alcohol dehydrogenase [Planctomycetota bacterium]MDP7253498.1 zinc-binding alcohol dehydrogenase [Planctomycetota bacterium]
MILPILHGPRDLRIEELPLDTDNLKPEEIWVETEISALKIGTDRGNYEGAEQVPGAPDYPRWVGDSNLGIVRGIGEAVERFCVGDRVLSLLPHQSDYVADENSRIVKVPDGIHPEDAVYGNLYTLSAHCYWKGHFRPGENVAIVGLGVLGMGAVAVGTAFGARVIGIGNNETRLEMAKKMGAHETLMHNDPELHEKLNEITDGDGVDLVIQTANPWPAYRTSCQIARKNGRVAIVSLPGRGEPPLDFNPLDMNWFYAKGLSLIAVSGPESYLYPAEEGHFDGNKRVAFILKLMKEGKVEPKRLVTHRFHYTDIPQAYEMAYRREKSMLGVIFYWKETP